MARQDVFEMLTTEQVLGLYEKVFGRLEPVSRRRFIARARLNGWDRTWDDDTAAQRLVA